MMVTQGRKQASYEKGNELANTSFHTDNAISKRPSLTIPWSIWQQSIKKYGSLTKLNCFKYRSKLLVDEAQRKRNLHGNTDPTTATAAKILSGIAVSEWPKKLNIPTIHDLVKELPRWLARDTNGVQVFKQLNI